MADVNTTTNDNSINPLLGLFTDDTLTSCSQILMFLEASRIEDTPSEYEMQGLSNIHYIVRKALEFEISRVSQLRHAKN